MYSVILSVLKKGARAPTRALLGATRNSSSVHSNDPVIIEREKQKSLAKSRYQTSAPIDNAEGWNEFLATHSELAVKADRHTVSSTADLQEKTVLHICSARQEDGDFSAQDAKAALGENGRSIDRAGK
ncbi:uncharacterized protein BT62DRAFT_1080166 [Guyanagaster necrorhizus]|uniref:Uncharacterized protein n=1 Tax=Guyanagaster necrorhizus TaxID=856835 RepID=A0A9P7VJD8_9AGAR|nr:uncharacterized protein BT62DRAFT_1080166 [Guyanagaster necrorhizus MCA 3950]KAG7441435.1 hypothetical protein BT62DRAFT_1080166 [Guyanagaster necrorhizus MCA 3950]